MFMAGALALADMSATRGAANAPLLPPINSLRGVAFAVARKAYQAQKDGVAEELGPAELDARIEKMMWVPEYRRYRRVEATSRR
jgi:malic enzyme